MRRLRPPRLLSSAEAAPAALGARTAEVASFAGSKQQTLNEAPSSMPTSARCVPPRDFPRSVLTARGTPPVRVSPERVILSRRPPGACGPRAGGGSQLLPRGRCFPSPLNRRPRLDSRRRGRCTAGCPEVSLGADHVQATPRETRCRVVMSQRRGRLAKPVGLGGRGPGRREGAFPSFLLPRWTAGSTEPEAAPPSARPRGSNAGHTRDAATSRNVLSSRRTLVLRTRLLPAPSRGAPRSRSEPQAAHSSGALSAGRGLGAKWEPPK